MENNVQQDTHANESHEAQASHESTNPAAAADAADTREDKQVPVSEAIRYRKRAQAAEQQLGELQAELQSLREQFDQAQQTITQLERRQRIDTLLAESEAIDLDTARLLTERAVADMDEPDVKDAVADLRRHKPYLFRRRTSESNGAMAPRLDETQPTTADDLAHRAATTGDRRDLLHYLRLRRQKTST